MEGNFSDFSEIPNVDAGSTDKARDKFEDPKRVLEYLKKTNKKLRKQNKLLKQLCRHTEMKETVVEETSTTPKNNCSSNTTAKKPERSFLKRLGDAFLKAFPGILRTIATVAVPLLFGHISSRFGNFKKGGDIKK